MKVVILSLALILQGFFLHAQTHTVTVYCELHPSLTGVVMDYFDLDKFLPDSLSTVTSVDYKKEYHLRNRNLESIILLMGTDGWKLASTYFHSPDNMTTYILSRDIIMDESAYQLYVQKIKARLRQN